MGLALLFKMLEKRAVPLAIAVPLNYLTCFAAGLFFSRPLVGFAELLNKPWLWLALFQGFFFYTSFSLLGLASQRIGVAIAALFSRVAIAVPVLVSFLWLGEAATSAKLAGIVVALVSLVLMINRGGRKMPWRGDSGLFMVIALFCLHGIQLSLMNLAQVSYLNGDHDYHAYMALSFGFACLISTSAAGVRLARKRIALRPGHIPAGIVLGLCNYSCVYYLIKALDAPGWGGGVVFPLFSVGVVGGSALAARAFFKERLTWRQWSGVGLGCLAVALIRM